MNGRLHIAPFADGPSIRTAASFVNGFELRLEGDWPVLVDPGPRGAEREHSSEGIGGIGCPGLWRVRREGGGHVRVFELPPLAPAEAADGTGEAGGTDDAGGRRPLAALLSWAEETAAGDAPRGWHPPARTDVMEWLGDRRLRAGTGLHTVQGLLVHEPERLALSFPRLVPIAPELPPARAAWMHELCREACERWRLVRVGPAADASAVTAEVDLTGVPPDHAAPLTKLSLEALVCAVEWVLPSLQLVVDPAVKSRLLDRRPPRVRPAQPRRKPR